MGLSTSAPPTGRTHRADGLAVLLSLGYPTLLTWLYFIALSRHSAATQQTAYTIGKVIQFAFPIAWVVWVVGHRPRPTWGPRWGLWFGVASGVAICAVMQIVYWGAVRQTAIAEQLASAVQDKLVGMGLDHLAAYAGLGLFYSLAHSLLEEYYWRWFVFGRLRLLVPLAAAVLISSLGFMAHHVLLLGVYFGFASPWTWLFSAAVGVGGILWAVLYDRTQSLVGPWISHLLVDAAIFGVGYDVARPLFQ